MIDKICNYLTNKIKNTMPEVDKERAEIIKVAGTTKVDIKLNEGVMASVQVMVVPKQ